MTRQHGPAHFGYKNHSASTGGTSVFRRYAVSSESVHDSQKLGDVQGANNSVEYPNPRPGAARAPLVLGEACPARPLRPDPPRTRPSSRKCWMVANRREGGDGLSGGASRVFHGGGDAGLVLPCCNTEGMTLHLAEISAAVAPRAHAMLLLDHCCFAWNRLVDQPWRIMSIGLRKWALG